MNRHSRGCRWFVALGAAASMVVLSSAATPPATSQKHEQFLVTADQATQQLMAGNARFVAHQLSHPHQDSGRLAEVAGGQKPVAVVLSCADSRLPPEEIFDQGLGDIFTVRVAGNIASPDVIGSIEYAVEHLGVPLIVVMGHEKCGAVSAAMAGGEAGNHIHVLVDAITPIVAEAKRDTKDPVDAAVRLNVKQVVGQLEHSQPTLARAVAAGHLQVVGAYYSLDHGTVTLLSGAPAAHASATKH
jgi:carbonic anhydrase